MPEGKWIKRKVDEHHCKMPKVTINDGVSENDIWECSCSRQYRISKVTSGTDPRPGEGDYFWVDWMPCHNGLPRP